MKLGFIGLGKMGKAMVLHLLENGVDVVTFNRSKEKVDELSKENKKQRTKNKACGNLLPSYTIRELVNNVNKPRIIWLMVEHGKPVDEMIKSLIDSGVKKGDIIIDGGNSFYIDSVRRYKYLFRKGIHFLDIGTSGGLEGAREGACLMIGGEKDIFEKLKPLFEKIVGKKGGYAYFGPAGAGHFVKMVHNGVEYGMLQALGEGFEILAKGPYKLDLEKVSQNWNKGSVVRGWLMELLERALGKDNKLEKIEGVVGGGSTGEWTVATAKELKVSTPVIEGSLLARKKTLEKPSFSGKVIAALRSEFGGHDVRIKK